MKRLVFVFPVILLTCFSACNNAGKKQENPLNAAKAKADSLEDLILKGHDIAMPKSMKIPDLQVELQRMIDSIGKLPAKAREAAAPYKSQLETINQDLGKAYSSMESWMQEFGEKFQELNKDSVKSNFEEKIKYYSSELPKIDEIKFAVVESVRRADSLLKSKKE
jgi:hypothetical protein